MLLNKWSNFQLFSLIALGTEEGCSNPFYFTSMPKQFFGGGVIVSSILVTTLILITYLTGGSSLQKTLFVSIIKNCLSVLFEV